MLSIKAALSLFVLFFLSSSSSAAPSSTAGNHTQSPYEIMQAYNFPIGILPKGALGYELDESTGKFRAYLNGTCGFSLEGSYQLRYKSTINGYISENRLTGLTGVSVKILFLWLDIVEVWRNGDELGFSVGIASASFPIDNFYECPQCGCGLECINLKVWNLRTNSLTSSI